MKRIRIVGLCLVAICSVFAFSATSAFGAVGSLEFGSCNKVAEGTGEFTNGGCTKPGGKKLFVWKSISGETRKFTSLLKEGTPVLENTAKEIISCTGQKEKTGEYGPGVKQIKNVIGEFSGCEGLKAKCNSEGKETGLIDTFKLTGEPGVAKKEANEEKNKVTTSLKAEETHKAEALLAGFSCGPLPVTVRGTVLIEKAPTNKMLTKTVVFFTAKEGLQNPSEWIPGAKYAKEEFGLEKAILEGNLAEKGYVRSGQSLITTQTASPKTQKTELRMCNKGAC